MQKIADKIKELRTTQRYSQEDIADKLGISQASYFQIEKGKTELTINRLYQIAEALGVGVGELMGVEVADNKGLSDSDKLRLAFYERGRLGLHNYLVMELINFAFDKRQVTITVMPNSDMTAQNPPYLLEYKEEKKMILDEYVFDRSLNTFLEILKASGLYEESEIFRLWNGYFSKMIPARYKHLNVPVEPVLDSVSSYKN